MCVSRLVVLDPLESTAQAHAEDHPYDLDDGNSPCHRQQIYSVLLSEGYQLVSTSLKENRT